METVTNTFEQHVEMCDVDNDNTCIASKSNAPVVDRLSTIDHARKSAGMHWTNVFDVAIDRSFWVSKDVLFSTFLARASQNIVQVLRHPQEPHCDSTRLASIEAAMALGSSTNIQASSPGNNSDNRTAQNELQLGTIMATSEIYGTMDTKLNVCVSCDNETPTQMDNSHVYSTLKTIDPTPLLLIQRRLNSVIALAATDMTEPICIHDTTLLVQDGYKQLAKRMKHVKRLIGDLPPSVWLSTMTSETTASNAVEVHNQGAILVELPNKISLASLNELLGMDFRLGEDLPSREEEEQFSIGTFLEHDIHGHGNFDSVLWEEKVMVSKFEYDNSLLSPPCFLDQRKSTIPSPSDTSYTYRSDDSWENERVDTYTSSDGENAMPFVFISPPSKSSTNNEEEIRSLLSQSILVSRRRIYMHRRPRRLLPSGKSILPRLVCMR